MKYFNPVSSALPAFALLFCLAAGSPLQASTNPSENDLKESRILIRKGDVKTAVVQLKKLVKSYPDSADARYELGAAEFLVGDFVGAERELSLARDYGFSLNQVNPKLAWVMLYQGKFDELFKSVPPCPDEAGCKAEVLSVYARAHLAQNKLDAAEEDIRAALEAQPEADSPRLARVLTLIGRGDLTGAELLVDQVLAAKPKQPEALGLKGDLRRQASDFASAENNYREALEISPRDLNVRLHMVMAIMAQDHMDDARSEIDKILVTAPKSVLAVYLKTMLLTRANKMQEALETVRPFEKDISATPQGTFLLALIHAGNNNLESAFKYAGTYHVAMPDNIVGTKLLARIEFRLGAFDRVVSLLGPLQDKINGDADALDLLGSAYLAEGRVKEANDVLSDAIKIRPDDQSLRGRLALSHVRQNATHEEGVHELEDMVNRDPKNVRLDLALFAAHMGSGDYDRAVAVATAMMGRQPNSPLPITLRGSAKLVKGDEQGAQSDFAEALKNDPSFVPAVLYRAEIDMHNGRFDPPRQALDGILKNNPADLRALLARAQVERRDANLAAAIPFLNLAINSHPQEIEPRTQLLQIYLELHDGEHVAATANDMARTMPNNPTAVDLAAKALIAVGKNEEGTGYYRQLQKTFPGSAQVHLQLGRAYLQSGKTEEAKSSFDRAIAANSKYLPAWIDRISLERQTKGFDAALNLARKAESSNPGNETFSLLVGGLMVDDGRLSEAEEVYRSAAGRAPSTAAEIRLFFVAIKRGDLPRARLGMEDWLKKHPDDVEARTALADGLLQAKDYRMAADQYEKLVAKMPRNVVAANNLAWAYDSIDDQRALPVAKQAYLLAPGEPSVIDTYGYMLYRKGDKKTGVEMVQQAFKLRPYDPSIAYHMAKLLKDRQDLVGARNLLKKIIDSKIQFDEEKEAIALYAQVGGG